MPRDLFAEIGAAKPKADKPRDLFAEIETGNPWADAPVTEPTTRPTRESRTSSPQGRFVQDGSKPGNSTHGAPLADQRKWLEELAKQDRDIAAFEKRMQAGEFGGGRGASMAGEQLGHLKRQRKDILNKIQAGREIKTTARDVGREVVNAPFRGVVNTALGGVAGGLDLFALDDVADSVRAYRDETTEKYGAPESASQNQLLRLGGSYGEGLGSTAPFLLGGAPVTGARVATGALAGGLGADEQDARVKAAREQGIEVSEGQEITSEWLGAGVGLTELLPIPAMIGRKGLGSKLSDAVSQRVSRSTAGRIAAAGVEEGAQEALAGVMQDTIERGIYNETATIGDNAAGDFAMGFAVGSTIRGGKEVVDRATGRLRNRPEDQRQLPPPGRVESAFEQNAAPTQEDINSPLDTGDIAAGRAGIAVAQAENDVSREFEAMGLPEIGAEVIVNDPETGAVRGKLVDRFTAEDGSGVVVQLENGSTLREYDDVLADVGVTITAARPLAEADAIDAQLAARAQASLETPAEVEPPSLPASSQEAPPSPASDTEPTPSGPVSDGGAIIRSIFGDKARITSTYRPPEHHLSKKNPNSWHTKSRAAVDMAPIPGMTFEQAKAAIEAQGYTLIEAINETGKGKTKHATGDHWHFVLGGGGSTAAATAEGGADVAMPERERDATVTIDDTDAGGPEALAMPAREPIPTRGKRQNRDGEEYFDPDQDDTAVTVTGREVPVKYRLAELDSLTASNTPDGAVNPNYPKERQPRDRSRAASIAQVEQIAGNLNPKLLGRSPKASDGAPIISPDGIVESGNGRTLALQKVYAANGEKAAAYRQFLEAEGYDTAGMQQPVLVRVRDGNISEADVQAFVREANARDTAGMSGTETAASDAEAIPVGVLDLFRGGDIDAAGNRDFVRKFMQALVPENERANLVMKDGSIAGSLIKRVEAVLLVRAVGPRSFIEKLVDGKAENIAAIGKALIDVAGPLAQMREAVKNGTVDASMDIADNIAEAVEIIDKARREGRNVSDLVNQRDVFSGDAVAPLTEAVLTTFFNGPRFTRPAGRARIAERLGFYIEQAEKAAPAGGLFGESTKAQPGDILGLANEKDRASPDGNQADLLAARPGQDERDGGDGAGVPQDGRDGAEQRGEGPLPQYEPEGRRSGEPDRNAAAGSVNRDAETASQDAEFLTPQPNPKERAEPTATKESQEQAGPTGPTSERQAASDVRGEEVRQGWRAFTENSGSLGIPRADMPQVRSEHRGALVNFLKARGVEGEEKTVRADSLKPTQAEFSPSKVAKAKAYAGGNRAILVSSEGHVVDGHHQWLAARDQSKKIRVIELDAPILDLLTIVKEFPSVEGEGGKRAEPSSGITEPPPSGDGGRSEKMRRVGEEYDRLENDFRRAQQKLDAFGNDRANFQSSGIKKRSRVIEKVTGEDYPSVTALKDVVRGGFFVESLSEAEAIIADLRDTFSVVQDKGWQTLKDSLYLDYKMIVEIDGMKAEVQIVPSAVWKVKKGEAGELYKASRNLAPTDPKRLAAEARQRELYAPAWVGTSFETVGNFDKSAVGNLAANSSRESVEPSLPSSPGASRQPEASSGQPASGVGQTSAVEPSSATGRSSTDRSVNEGNASISDNIVPGTKNSKDSIGENLPDYPTVNLRMADWGPLPKRAQNRFAALKKRATSFYRSKLVGTTVTASDGRKVVFSRNGAQNMISKNGDRLLLTVRVLPKMLERGRYLYSEPARGNDLRQIKAFHRYGANVRLPDGDIIPAVVVVREAQNGTFYYSTQEWRETSDTPAQNRPAGMATSAKQSALDGGAEGDPDIGLDSLTINAALDQAQEQLREALGKLRISDRVRLNLVDALTRGAQGRYTPGERLIEIARNSVDDKPFILNHEVIHAMREMGLFKDSEWAILIARAKREPGLMRSIEKRYKRLGEEARNEEAVADLFARYQRGDLAPRGVVASVLRMLRNVMEAVRNFASGVGARSGEGIMDDIATGRVGARSGQARGGAARDATAPAFEDVDSILDRAGFPAAVYDGFDVTGPDDFDRRGLSVEAARRVILEAMPRAEYDRYFEDVLAWTGGEAQFGAFKIADATARYSIPETGDLLSEAGRTPSWKDKGAEAWDSFRTAMQDRYLPLLRTQQTIEKQTGRNLPENLNPYLGEELMAGRIGSRLEALMEDNVRPLFDAMADEGVTTDELESYLYARHAPERNARIAEINPEFDGDNGSGMTNLEARAVMARITRDGKMEAMERLAERVDRMRDMALDYRVETGLMSQEDADAWRATYEHYVPLRGFKEVEGDPASAERINRSGGGINVRGKESRAAYGRRSQADSPLAYTILQAEEAIVRGETNRVAQRFVNLARANPDEDFWEVNKVSSRRKMNPETGLVESYDVNQITAEDKDFTVVAKFDGKEVRITMNRENEAASRLADSMRNLTQHKLDFVTRYFGVINRFLSRMNTSFNPEFTITNAFRDIQTAAVNLTGEELDGMVKGTLKDYRKALVASTKGAFRKGDGEWRQWYEEFVSEGGRVYFNDIQDLGRLKKRLETDAALAGATEMKTTPAQARIHAKRLFRGAVQLIENLNLGVENAVRLAAYKNARERGMSKTASASLAKNLTVNFNRRGTAGPLMNSLYMFYNAGIQGTTRLILALRSKRARRLLYGVMAGGAAVEMLNAALTGTDDDEEDFYDKIPPHVKERNLVLMLPDGEDYVTIPLPYGYSTFWEGGRTAAEIARRGGYKWQESAGNFITAVANSFNPVGGNENILNFLAPTILDPVVDLQQNEDFTGRPIMPEQNPFDSPDPDHQRYYPGVSPNWKQVAHALNDLTGGDDVLPGAVSVSPETMEYLFGFATGGAGRFVEDVFFDLPALVIGSDPDHETTIRDFPFARRLYGSVSPWADKGLYYERTREVDLAVDNAKAYIEREQFDEAREYSFDAEMLLSLEPVKKAADREMRKIRKARRANEGAYELGKIDEQAYRDEKKVIEEAEGIVVQSFNTQWNRALEKHHGI